MKRLVNPPLDRRFYRTKAKGITSAKRLHIGRERLFVVALSLWLAGCNNQQPAAQGPPPAEVTVSKPEQKEVVNWNEFTGRTAAVKLVTVTAPVSGYIVDIPFKEGDIVHKGDLLFQIDPRPYQLTSRRLASCSRRKPISTAGCDVRTPTAFARDESYRERRLRYGFVQQEPSRGAGDLRASGTQFGPTES